VNPGAHRNRKTQPNYPAPSSAADVADTVLEKGADVDHFYRVSLLGLEVGSVDGPWRLRRGDEGGLGGGRAAPVVTEAEVEDSQIGFFAREAELSGMDRADLAKIPCRCLR
jgi:hypothetical protein